MTELVERSQAIARGEQVQPTEAMARASVRRRLRELMAEATQDDDGTPMPWSDRIALGLARRAATGNVPAVELVIEQTDGPLPKSEQGDWHVTIQYVHQQLNVSAEPSQGLEAPDTER